MYTVSVEEFKDWLENDAMREAFNSKALRVNIDEVCSYISNYGMTHDLVSCSPCQIPKLIRLIGEIDEKYGLVQFNEGWNFRCAMKINDTDDEVLQALDVLNKATSCLVALRYREFLTNRLRTQVEHISATCGDMVDDAAEDLQKVYWGGC